MSVRLFGWDREQWAIALGEIPIDAVNTGPLEVQKAWRERHAFEPGQCPLVGFGDPVRDYGMAMALIESFASFAA